VSTHQLPEHPDFLWRNPEPKSSYDAVIVGGGGHGLATAYFLAKNHGMTNIAVLEKGWLAGGNMARNTTIIRSNYLWDESAAIYEHALKLWEILPEELDYDFLFSQRDVMNLAHTLGDVRESIRRVGANNAELDEGPIISQQVVEVDHTYGPEDLVAAGRDTECKALSNAVRWHCEGRVILQGNRTVVLK
jgi:sarcosine oxidase subunit beta